MKYVLSSWLMEFANKCSKIPFVKPLLKPFYYRYKENLQNKRNRNFHLSALDMLTSFDKCMTENNIQYTLIFGSLLGAIREKGFIKHDLDVDVALFIEEKRPDIYDVMASYGFKVIHKYSVDNDALGCEETYEYKDSGISLDIFYIYPAIDEYSYVCCWNIAEGCTTVRESIKKIGGVYPRRIEQPVSKTTRRVPFETIEVSITDNAEQCLEFAYGKDYMIPDPNYVVPREHRFIWYDKIATYISF